MAENRRTVCLARLMEHRLQYTTDGFGSRPTARRVQQQAVGGNPADMTISDLVSTIHSMQECLRAALAAEYYCEDLIPPTRALGWSEVQLRAFFERGGDDEADAKSGAAAVSADGQQQQTQQQTQQQQVAQQAAAEALAKAEAAEAARDQMEAARDAAERRLAEAEARHVAEADTRACAAASANADATAATEAAQAAAEAAQTAAEVATRDAGALRSQLRELSAELYEAKRQAAEAMVSPGQQLRPEAPLQQTPVAVVSTGSNGSGGGVGGDGGGTSCVSLDDNAPMVFSEEGLCTTRALSNPCVARGASRAQRHSTALLARPIGRASSHALPDGWW